MPANLSPDYRAAEERFRHARSVEDKIAGLEEMLRLIPKHKGTEKLQADLKSRLAKYRRQPKKKGPASRADTSHNVAKEGAGQIALIGPPSTGKSSLVAALTHAHPEVGDYPFTTRDPIPGMMPFEDIAFQLVDLPPLSAEHIEPWVYDLARRADLIWLVVRAANALDELNLARDLLAARRVGVVPAEIGTPAAAGAQQGDGTQGAASGADAPAPDTPRPGQVERPALLVVTGLDLPEGPDDIDILMELLEEPWPVIAVSGKAKLGLDELARRTFEALRIVRVYTKQPGHPPDHKRPFTFRSGATVDDLARTIHKDLLQGIKFARIWGTHVFDGQTVQREHVLEDGDVVEIHA